MQTERFQLMRTIDVKLFFHWLFQNSFQNIERHKHYRNFWADRSELVYKSMCLLQITFYWFEAGQKLVRSNYFAYDGQGALGKDSSGVASLKENGKMHADPKDKTNILNRQYESVYTREDTSKVPGPSGQPYQSMGETAVAEQGVRKLFQKMNPRKDDLSTDTQGLGRWNITFAHSHFPRIVWLWWNSRGLEIRKYHPSI